MGLEAGATPRILSQVLAGRDAALPEDVHLGVTFARATIAHHPDADELREEIVRRWGQRALLSLAFAITASRVFPTIKYALGHGKACQRVTVAGEHVAVVRSAAA
jgi:hypothetical protein